MFYLVFTPITIICLNTVLHKTMNTTTDNPSLDNKSNRKLYGVKIILEKMMNTTEIVKKDKKKERNYPSTQTASYISTH